MSIKFSSMIRQVFFALIAISLLTACAIQKKEEPSLVEVKKNDQGNYRLFVDGNEFFIKGAGLANGNIKALADNGGNSFRTWGTGDAIKKLDEAQKYDLKVLMGLSVARERHGFDYNDSLKVKAQFDRIKQEVEQLKYHPALLGWAIGNELNLGTKNLKVYNAVNDISKMIHEIDPNHITTTTLAGIGKREVDYIKIHCTDIDFLSIQLYGGIVNLQKHLDKSGWDGPYVLTEWGATGHWEVDRTKWNVAIEQTSKQKAEAFMHRYNEAILNDEINCMGSYVFLWGQKQERTPTWYGMFLDNGAKTETVDAMCKVWSGKWPENRCPALDSFKMEGKTSNQNVKIKIGSTFESEVFITNYDNDTLSYKWEIMHESTDHGWGGDFEKRPQTTFSKVMDSKVEIHAPDTVGPFRLFVYVFDNNGNAATANIPFLIEN